MVLMALVVLMAVPAGPALAQEEAVFAGTAVIWDDASLSDAVTFTMTNVPAAASGTAYEGWLVSDDGSVKLSTGILDVQADGSVNHSYSSPTGENLIHNYDKVVITLEPVPDSDPTPSSVVPYASQIPAGGMAHIRHLLTDWPGGSGVGILTNLQTQLGVAILHSNLAKNQTTIAGIHQHIEHVINAIEGTDGANYGDLDGNGSVEDFGDGIGVLGHAADRKHAGFASGAASDVDTLVEHAALVETHGASAADRATQARDQALAILGTSNVQLAKIYLGPGANSVITLLEVGLEGSVLTGEGGAEGAYVEAQLMATYTLEAGEAVTSAPSVGDTTVPLLAQIALIASVMLLVIGGLLVLNARRSRVRI